MVEITSDKDFHIFFVAKIRSFQVIGGRMMQILKLMKMTHLLRRRFTLIS